MTRACDPKNRIHFNSQSWDLKLIGITELKIVIFGQNLAHFWSFLGNFWLVVKFVRPNGPNDVQHSHLQAKIV